MYRDIPEDLRVLIEPVVEDHECELVNVEVPKGTRAGVFRITVDNRAGDGRIPIDVCERVSREIETVLDASDAIPGRYRLEVSSPGLDRVLAREKDFAASCGAEVKLQTKRPLDGRRRFRGVLREFRDGVARVVIDGSETEIPFDEIERANKIYSFSRVDFTGRAAK